MLGRITQVSISSGGVPKHPVPEVFVSVDGLTGDWQKNRKYHGGPDRAVCLFSAEVIAALTTEGHPIFPGSTGENLTVSGLPRSTLQVGTRLLIGDSLVIEVASYATPCQTISGSFSDGKFGRISSKRSPQYSRLYARVLKEGTVRAGDSVSILPSDSQPTP